jgi:hypothetical protein
MIARRSRVAQLSANVRRSSNLFTRENSCAGSAFAHICQIDAVGRGDYPSRHVDECSGSYRPTLIAAPVRLLPQLRDHKVGTGANERANRLFMIGRDRPPITADLVRPAMPSAENRCISLMT